MLNRLTFSGRPVPARRPVTRTVALVMALGLAASACSGSEEAEVTTTTVAEETTTTVADETTTTTEVVDVGPTMPMTGMPIEDESLVDRPALAIKIDNHVQARPQTGLNVADIVFEMRAEGVTRFMAVYHSQTPQPAGPVRSSRTSDFDLLRGLDNPLYASSGGNDFVASGLRQLPIQAVTNLTNTEYFRDGSRPAPHNLYIDAADLWALAEADEAPEPWFTYRSADDELSSTARAISEPVTIAYAGSPVVTHAWDAERAGWLRTQDGRPHTTIEGDQLAPENVVIMIVDYTISAADPTSPELQSVGSGELYVLTDGNLIEGIWSRETAESKPVLMDSEGNEIALTPGRTWVLYPEAGNVSLPVS